MSRGGGGDALAALALIKHNQAPISFGVTLDSSI